MLSSTRHNYFFGLLVTLLLLVLSFYLQMHGMVPCALCLFQRVILGLLGVIFFVGMLVKFKRMGHILAAVSTLIIASLGMLLAGRQTWLQHYPSQQAGECAASLQYMLQVLPLNEVIQKVLQGSTECTEVAWSFIGLSLAEWSLICFVAFFLFGVYQLFRALLRRD